MDNKIDLTHFFEEAKSLYYGIEKNKDVEKAFEIFQHIMVVGKSGWGEFVYPDIFNDYVFYKYDDGSKENKDYELAARLYDLAALNGSLNALNNISFLYLNGLGVEKNINKAEEYWILASEKGDDKSQMNLVNLYQSNQYEKLDYSKAIFYCELASKQDNQNAIDLLPILTIAERRFNSCPKWVIHHPCISAGSDLPMFSS
jgi:TPR repeat protein